MTDDPKIVNFEDAARKRLASVVHTHARMDRLMAALPVMQQAIASMRQLGCTNAEIVSTLQTAVEVLRSSED